MDHDGIETYTPLVCKNTIYENIITYGYHAIFLKIF